MAYSFKQEVIDLIPAPHKFTRMYPANGKETHVETYANGVRYVSVMEKVDMGTLFSKLPTIHVGTDMTYNDLYREISDLYGLGLVRNIDYYNSDAVKPSSVPRYVELPISDNSYGYYGKIRCHVVLGMLKGMCGGITHDLRSMNIEHHLLRIKIKSTLMSKCFTGTGTDANFIDDRFSLPFIDYFINEVQSLIGNTAAAYFSGILSKSIVTDFFSDGISDIVVMRCPDGETFLIRIKTLVDDIPVISNESIDVKTDDSKGLLVGDEIEVSEDPGEGKGDLNIQQSDSDIFIDVSSPEEGMIEDILEETIEDIIPKKRTRKKI